MFTNVLNLNALRQARSNLWLDTQASQPTYVSLLTLEVLTSIPERFRAERKSEEGEGGKPGAE